MSGFSNEVIVVNVPDVTVSAGISVTNFPATQAVTGPLTDTQLRATPVPISGTVTTSPVSSSSSTVAQISSTGSNQTLLAANANRKKAILHFTTGTWYVKFGATASATSRTYVVPNTAFDIEETIWKGTIDAFCTSTAKLVDVTELV